MPKYINEVKNGLHRDFDEIHQPEGTYRESLNGEIFQTGTGKYGWRTKKGNEYSFSITSGMIPLYGIPIIDKLIILSASAFGYSEIGLVVINDLGPNIYYTIYNHVDLAFSIDYPIKGKGNRESPTIERIYWRDGNSHPKVMNLLDIIKSFTDPYISDLVQGQEYLTISVNPAHFTLSPGDVYTAPINFSVDNTQDKFVKYIPVKMLDWTPDAEAGSMFYDSLIDGGLLYGSYFITWRLGLNSGFVTPWMKMVGPINILSIPSALSLAQYPLTDPPGTYQGSEGKSHQVVSQSGIRLNFENVDTSYDYIQLAYIHAKDKDTSEGAYLSIKQEIGNNTALTMDFKYNLNLGIVTITDLITKNVVINDFTDLSILKYRMNIGNVTEGLELSIGQKIDGVTIRPELHSYCADNRGIVDSTDSNAPVVNSVIERDGNGYPLTIMPGQHYLVTAKNALATGPFIYAGNSYNIGDILIGTAISYYDITHQDCYPKPVIEVRKYFTQKAVGSIPAGTPIMEYHDLQYFYDYKDPNMGLYAKGYWGEQRYRYAIIAFDTHMNPLFARFIGDYMMPARRNATSIKSDVTTVGGYPKIASMLPTGLTDGDSVNGELFTEYTSSGKKVYAGNILSTVIDDLDLTDIIDQIHAFAIIRCVREKTIISEGFLEPVRTRVNNSSINSAYTVGSDFYITRRRYSSLAERMPFEDEAHHWYPKEKRVPYAYVLVTPEQIFNTGSEVQIDMDDHIILKRYMDNQTLVEESHGNMYAKTCKECLIHPVTGDGFTPIDTTAMILSAAKSKLDPNPRSYIYEDDPSSFFRNIGGLIPNPQWAITEDYNVPCVGGACSPITLDFDGNGNGFGYWISEPLGKIYIPIVQHIRTANTDYGGNSSLSIGSSQFIFTNHFQIIDANFKNSIETSKVINGILQTRYIVSGIQLFGGDCFINAFDYKRVYSDPYYVHQWYVTQGVGPTNYASVGESFIIPIQSEMNLALRTGRHFAKHRSFGMYSNGTGIQFDSGLKYADQISHDQTPNLYEEFLYDDSYSSEHCQVMLPGTPENLDLNNIFPERVRYSLKKIEGETIDTYRVFKSENKIDLFKEGGPISNIIGYKDRLFYWQQLVCGFIPAGERTMTINEVGQPVQLGIGGQYERIDDITKFYGAQGKYSVIITPEGFVWFDAIRKTWLHMGYDMGLTEESIIKGLSNDFNNKVKDYLTLYDNLAKGEGIALFFAPEEKVVYGTFQDPVDTSNSFMIGYNIIKKAFVGNMDFFPTMTVIVENKFYSTAGDAKIWLHNRGPSRNFYGTYHDSYIHLVINPHPELHKSFLNGEMVQSDNFFDEVTYRCIMGQGKVNTVVSISERPASYPQYYESRLGQKWVFNFPADNGRLIGLFLSLIFKDDSAQEIDNSFHELITHYTNTL